MEVSFPRKPDFYGNKSSMKLCGSKNSIATRLWIATQRLSECLITIILRQQDAPLPWLRSNRWLSRQSGTLKSQKTPVHLLNQQKSVTFKNGFKMILKVAAIDGSCRKEIQFQGRVLPPGGHPETSADGRILCISSCYSGTTTITTRSTLKETHA